MKTNFSGFLLKLAGWKVSVTVEIPQKCVICLAPHTSNWDFLVGELFYSAINQKASFLIKDSWFFFPVNILMNSLGGIGVDRSKRNDITEQMAQEFKSRTSFQLAVTPEGTRKLNARWKKGFYYIAVKANVPILLIHFDYAKKELCAHRVFVPTGNEEADLREIKLHYKDVIACHPENFTIGKV